MQSPVEFPALECPVLHIGLLTLHLLLPRLALSGPLPWVSPGLSCLVQALSTPETTQPCVSKQCIVGSDSRVIPSQTPTRRCLPRRRCARHNCRLPKPRVARPSAATKRTPTLNEGGASCKSSFGHGTSRQHTSERVSLSTRFTNLLRLRTRPDTHGTPCQPRQGYIT